MLDDSRQAAPADTQIDQHHKHQPTAGRFRVMNESESRGAFEARRPRRPAGPAPEFDIETDVVDVISGKGDEEFDKIVYGLTDGCWVLDLMLDIETPELSLDETNPPPRPILVTPDWVSRFCARNDQHLPESLRAIPATEDCDPTVDPLTERFYRQCRVWKLERAGLQATSEAAVSPPVASTIRPPAVGSDHDTPEWNPNTRELSFRGKVLLKLKANAKRQIELLGHFSRYGWRQSLTFKKGDYREMSQAANDLNKRLREQHGELAPIRFNRESDQITWTITNADRAGN